MKDLKKIENNFHNLIKNIEIGDDYKFPKLTRDLLKKEEFVHVPGMCGGFICFLSCENEKIVLYANTISTVNEMFRIDDESYEWIRNGDYRKIRAENNIEIFFEDDDSIWEL
ncbi:MAG: hypothetical protein J6P12_10645 [Methanobrevibacter sp.]|nr:hypothetical protein [Methanobrevibacter sp.]